MGKMYFILLLLVSATSFNVLHAQDAPVLTFSVPYQNNVKYNRFLINPAFSFVREDNTYITMYHRNQWVQYDDAPKVYMLSYNGKFTDKAGFGFGIYQQRLGVISSFGGIGNYAYNVKIKDKFDITLGFNVAYYNSGIDKNRTITEEPDPVLMAMRNNSLVSIKPGINVGYKGFDFGVYAENFVDYDFKSAGMAKLFTNKTYSGHAMYTYNVANGKDLFKDSMLRVMLRAKTSEEFGFGLSGSFLADFPSFGWLQTGIDDYYGVAIGAGFHFTKRLSLGYTFERTTKEGLVNLGPTHEITMVFSFKDRAVAKQELLDEKKKQKDTLAVLDEKLKAGMVKQKDSVAAVEKEEAGFDSKGELEKLKLDMDSDSQHLVEALIKEDSVSKVKKSEFEQKVKNLKDYVAREKAAKEEAGENKPLELKNIKQGKRIAKPETLEDLKYAEDGYYVVSKDVNAKAGDKKVAIEKHKTFTEAANASEKKRDSGKEKGVYIVHVDNNPNPELEQEIISNNNPNTLQNENPTQQKQTKETTAVAVAQPEVKAPTEKAKASNVESAKAKTPKEGIFSSKAPEVITPTEKAEASNVAESAKAKTPKEGMFSSKAPEAITPTEKAEVANVAESAKAKTPREGIFSSKAPEAMTATEKAEAANVAESAKAKTPREGIFSSKAPEAMTATEKAEAANVAESAKAKTPREGIFSSKAPEAMTATEKAEVANVAESTKAKIPREGIFSSKAPEAMTATEKAEAANVAESAKAKTPKEGIFSSKAPEVMTPTEKAEEVAKANEPAKTKTPKEGIFSSKAPEVITPTEKAEKVAKADEPAKTKTPREGIFSSKAPEAMTATEVAEEVAKADEPAKAKTPREGIFSSKAPEVMTATEVAEQVAKAANPIGGRVLKEGIFSSKAPDKLPPVSSLKTEEEIKDFYSDKTSQPRESVKKVSRMAVEGMDSGYYIIANVFSEQDRVENFVNKMAERGIRTGIFLNPKNNYSYVYLKKYSTWREALISYYSNVDNTYFDPIWIMSINTN